jgi:hypothetical protein
MAGTMPCNCAVLPQVKTRAGPSPQLASKCPIAKSWHAMITAGG